MTFSFLPADIVSQILNFGAPAPIDLQVAAPISNANFRLCQQAAAQDRRIPGVADARIQQSPRNPSLNVDVDRTRAQYVGLTERDVTNSLVVNLAGSAQVAPTYWLNPENGVSYPIVMQTPQYQIDSLSALQNLPITARRRGQSPMLGGIANITRARRERGGLAIRHPADGADLRDAAGPRSRRGRRRHPEDRSPTPPRTAEGQRRVAARPGADHEQRLLRLLFGLLGAIVLIYLLIVVNFQSWSIRS
jgi:hypothetical protein